MTDLQFKANVSKTSLNIIVLFSLWVSGKYAPLCSKAKTKQKLKT